MKVVLLCACVVGLVGQALAARYHERVGIPMARKIRLQESMRIAGGLASYSGEHPYYAGLIITLKTDITSICGGTLLSHYHVLTIGQCWYDGENEGKSIQVVLGTATLFTGGTRTYADTVTLHSDYDPDTLANDIGIIKMQNYVYFDKYVDSIILPEAYFSSLAGYKAEIIGYGRTSPDAPLDENSTLNDVYVRVMNNTDCAQIYGDSLITRDVMCTSGANGKGACGGDYGGPLVLRRFSNDEDMLVGLVSFTAAAGCNAGFPTGYTRITSHLRWIKKFL
ncbi:collagenase-like isoform X3 [Spodoptera frugiperda]|uniref:Collagenase-like isoform X2 n=1 Tax=Spodoptera frugiperda TaxID=7108 RepID=A0A9R0EA96_SPOFR|nr:collagenase-like isoform X2 [Spodoptera frugiperda]XP_050561566.1 collagenase-like isoform X3 [Spodoptera frugiperda]